MLKKKINRKQLAARVVKQLKKHDIDSVLVGGACVSIYTNDKHHSHDLDFISSASNKEIEKALSEVGFTRSGRYFKHSNSDYYVEFPSGPVGIGSDSPVKPEGVLKVGRTSIKMYSPSQCVMDRLAAWFYWNDRRSLIHAIWVCEKQPVNLSKVKKWAEKEGDLERFHQFISQLKLANKSK